MASCPTLSEKIMNFINVYEDARRAEAYAKLEFPGSYYLAYRDLPAIMAEHVTGKKTIDFGCGTGRSTRFLQKLGFDAIGIDIAADMIKQAREIDPSGDYRLVKDDDFSQLKYANYDLVLSVFTFDNIPTMEKKVINLRGLRDLLRDDGVLINLVSSPEIYTHEWTSFSTKDFPENRAARSGDIVRIIQLDIDDKRPVSDVLWTAESYRETYRSAQLKIVHIYKPLAKKKEPYGWVNETRIAPWTIYVLRREWQGTDKNRPVL